MRRESGMFRGGSVVWVLASCALCLGGCANSKDGGVATAADDGDSASSDGDSREANEGASEAADAESAADEESTAPADGAAAGGNGAAPDVDAQGSRAAGHEVSQATDPDDPRSHWMDSPEVEAACIDYANVKCDRVAECSEHYEVDWELCVLRVVGDCFDNVGLADSPLTLDALDECRTRIEARDCAQLLGSHHNDWRVSHCVDSTGTRDNGEACWAFHQCVSGRCGAVEDCRHCLADYVAPPQPPIADQELEALLDPPNRPGCANPLLVEIDGRCEARAPGLGEPCDLVDCEAPLQCRLGDCSAVQPEGSPCFRDQECETGTRCEFSGNVDQDNAVGTCVEGERMTTSNAEPSHAGIPEEEPECFERTLARQEPQPADASIGRSCTPARENTSTFGGYTADDFVIEAGCGAGGVCLVDHFQGRRDCPYGGDAGECAEVAVLPQYASRRHDDAVYCSCRCGGDDPTDPYCVCGDGFSCTRISEDLGGGTGWGSFCVRDATAIDDADELDGQPLCDPDTNRCDW